MTRTRDHRPYEMVVIGASAGGISALRKIIGCIPAAYPMPIVVVQHMHAGIHVEFSMVFNNNPSLIVKEAEDKQTAEAGTLYIAPPGYHLLIERDGSFALSVDEMVNFSRPSIDVLFETAAEAYREAVVGVILTGANCDGARGLKAVKDAGGLTVVEDPLTAEVPIMPCAAIGTTRVDHVMSVEQIGAFLANLGGTGGSRVHVEDQDSSRR